MFEFGIKGESWSRLYQLPGCWTDWRKLLLATKTGQSYTLTSFSSSKVPLASPSSISLLMVTVCTLLCRLLHPKTPATAPAARRTKTTPEMIPIMELEPPVWDGSNVNLKLIHVCLTISSDWTNFSVTFVVSSYNVLK